MKRKIVYIDMDGVVADFDKAFPRVAEKTWVEGENKKVPENFFCELELIPKAKWGLQELDKLGYDLYFLSTPQWSNPNCWKEKRIWVELHFGELMFKRLILTHNKSLLKGDYLIDDRTVNGVEEFDGKHVHFGSDEFPDWISVITFFQGERYKELNTYFKETVNKLIDDSMGDMLS